MNTEIQTPKGFSLRKNSFELYTGQLTQDEPDNHIAGVTLGTFLFFLSSYLFFADYDTNKFVRYVLATDTSLEKQKWCDGVKTVLDELRTWDSTLPQPIPDQLDDY